jgi:hypothetical protein
MSNCCGKSRLKKKKKPTSASFPAMYRALDFSFLFFLHPTTWRHSQRSCWTVKVAGFD